MYICSPCDECEHWGGAEYGLELDSPKASWKPLLQQFQPWSALPPVLLLTIPGQGQVVRDGGVVGDMGWSVGEGSTLEPQAHVEEVGVLSIVTTTPSVFDLERFRRCDIFNR